MRVVLSRRGPSTVLWAADRHSTTSRSLRPMRSVARSCWKTGLCVLLCGLIAGCGTNPPAGQYLTYEQLLEQERQNAAAQKGAASDTTPLEPTFAPELATTGNSTTDDATTGNAAHKATASTDAFANSLPTPSPAERPARSNTATGPSPGSAADAPSRMIADASGTRTRPSDGAGVNVASSATETGSADPGATGADVLPDLPISALAAANVIDGSSAADLLQLAARTTKPSTTPQPLQIELLIPEKSFKIEGPQKAIRVSYDDIDLLKVLNMEPVPVDATKHFPPWLAGLHGQRIRIRGFMYPPAEETGIEQFLLARDNQICCFGRNPKPYDLVNVTMRTGVTTHYIYNRPFDVVGVFRIDLIAEGGQLLALYWLDDAVVLGK